MKTREEIRELLLDQPVENVFRSRNLLDVCDTVDVATMRDLLERDPELNEHERKTISAAWIAFEKHVDNHLEWQRQVHQAEKQMRRSQIDTLARELFIAGTYESHMHEEFLEDCYSRARDFVDFVGNKYGEEHA